jgi:uncharacterized membrane protein
MNSPAGNGPDRHEDGDSMPVGRSLRVRRQQMQLALMARLRAYFFAGILVTAPIGITFYLAWQLVSFIDARVTPLIPARFNPESYLPFAIPGLGVVVVVATLVLIGAFTAGLLGRLLTGFFDAALARMPVIRSVYGALKQIVETVLAKKSGAFREAVLIEYPRRGIWTIGFLTGVTEGEVQAVTGEDVINVFVPTTPNPTSGFLLFVPRTDIIALTMSVEDALKMVVSGGIVTPPTEPTPELSHLTPRLGDASR